MAHKDPARFIGWLQSRYAAVELMREEIKRLEAIVRAEEDVIRSDVEAEHGLDLSTHMIAVARGMFDLAAHRGAGTEEALAILADDGLFAAAKILWTPSVTTPAAIDPLPAVLQAQEPRPAVVAEPQARVAAVAPEVAPAVVAAAVESRKPATAELMFGVSIKAENVEEAKEVVATARRDAARGVDRNPFKDSRGKYIWRNKLYRAVFAAAAGSNSSPGSAPDNVKGGPSSTDTADPPDVAVRPSVPRPTLGMRPRPPAPADNTAGETGAVQPVRDEVFGLQDEGNDPGETVSGDGNGASDGYEALEVPGFLMDGDDAGQFSEPHYPGDDDDDPGGGPAPERFVADGGYDDGDAPDETSDRGLGQPVRYRENIAGDDVFDQKGQQGADKPVFRQYGMGNNAYGLNRGLGRRSRMGLRHG